MPCDWEIVVADNGSTDVTADIVRSFAGARVPVRLADAGPRAGRNRARNGGVRAASGRLVLMCDCDDVVEPGWVDAMRRRLEAGADVVGGPVRRGDELDTGLQTTHDFLPWARGQNCGFRREVYDELGGFDESYRGGADPDFSWRAQLRGRRLDFAPDAVIRYVPRASIRGAFRQKFRFGFTQTQLYARFASAGMPRSSTRAALATWIRLPAYALMVALRTRRAMVAAERCGYALGRACGSISSRVWYP